MDAKSLLLRIHIRRIVRRFVAVLALVGVVYAWASGRIDPVGGVARTFAFVKEKADGKKQRGAEPAAPAQIAATGGKLDNQTLCLAHAVYFEAGADARDVQVAVAQVVINRTLTPKGATDMRAICRVVYRGLGRPLGCLFKSTCQNIGTLPDDQARWAKAIEVAKDVAAGRAELPPLIQHASHFHPVGPRPVWTSSVNRLTRIGRMVFYSSRVIDPAASAQLDGGSVGKLSTSATDAAHGGELGAASPAAASKAGVMPPRVAPPAAPDAQKARDRAAKAIPQRSPFGEAFQQ